MLLYNHAQKKKIFQFIGLQDFVPKFKVLGTICTTKKAQKSTTKMKQHSNNWRSNLNKKLQSLKCHLKCSPPFFLAPPKAARMTLALLTARLCLCCRHEYILHAACITADLCGHFSCVVAVPHLALCRKSITKMIRSQPSVMSVIVKSIGVYEDESIPCCSTAGSLTTKQKTIHGSSQTDGWCCLVGEGAEDMLYDTDTVTTFPGLEDGLEMLQVVYDVVIQQLIDIHLNGCCWFSLHFIYPGKVCWAWPLFFNKHPVSNSYIYTQSHLQSAQCQFDSSLHRVYSSSGGKSPSRGLELITGAF